MREIRMLRAMWRELETGPRITLAGHEGGNPGYRQESSLWVTAPALDPTRKYKMSSYTEFFTGSPRIPFVAFYSNSSGHFRVVWNTLRIWTSLPFTLYGTI